MKKLNLWEKTAVDKIAWIKAWLNILSKKYNKNDFGL